MKGALLKHISNISYTTILVRLNTMKSPDDTEPVNLQYNYFSREITSKVSEETITHFNQAIVYDGGQGVMGGTLYWVKVGTYPRCKMDVTSQSFHINSKWIMIDNQTVFVISTAWSHTVFIIMNHYSNITSSDEGGKKAPKSEIVWCFPIC